MLIKVRHERASGHVHMGIWMGKHEGALGKCGELVMRQEEFELWRQHCKTANGDLQYIFIEEGTILT